MVCFALSCQGKGDGGEERENVWLPVTQRTNLITGHRLRGTSFGTSLLKSEGEVPPRMGKDDESNKGKTRGRDLSPVGDCWGHPVSPPPCHGPHKTEEHRGLHRCLLHERESRLLGWLLLARFPRALHRHLLLHLGTHPKGVTSHSPLGKLLSLVNIPVHSQ